jgi:hypothetical protein
MYCTREQEFSFGSSAKAAYTEHGNELTEDSTYTVPDHSPEQLSSDSSCT